MGCVTDIECRLCFSHVTHPSTVLVATVSSVLPVNHTVMHNLISEWGCDLKLHYEQVVDDS